MLSQVSGMGNRSWVTVVKTQEPRQGDKLEKETDGDRELRVALISVMFVPVPKETLTH